MQIALWTIFEQLYFANSQVVGSSNTTKKKYIWNVKVFNGNSEKKINKNSYKTAQKETFNLPYRLC